MGDKLICITKNRKAMKIIILHDADARIEYLDVADHLLGSDIEEFLTRQGFSVNNITWLVTSADQNWCCRNMEWFPGNQPAFAGLHPFYHY